MSGYSHQNSEIIRYRGYVSNVMLLSSTVNVWPLVTLTAITCLYHSYSTHILMEKNRKHIFVIGTKLYKTTDVTNCCLLQ